MEKRELKVGDKVRIKSREELERLKKAEEKKLFVLVHDNRCMRRVVNSPEEAKHFAEWIQKDKPVRRCLCMR